MPEKTPGPRLLMILALIGVLVALWMFFVFSRPQETSGPAAVSQPPQPETAAKHAADGERLQKQLAPPIHRRLTDEELRSQLPPGATIIE